jgi:hypothetical protein
VITPDVVPSLHVDDKHATIKQYHKENRALRTETTINDTRDFSIGKRLINLPALRQVGFQANRRLLDVQTISHDPIAGHRALAAVVDPVFTPSNTRVAGMRLTDPRVQALLTAILIFRLLPRGFTNRDLRAHLAPLLGRDPSTMTSGQMSYDLRRLRLHGIIERIPPLPAHPRRPPPRDVPHPPPQPRPGTRPRRSRQGRRSTTAPPRRGHLRQGPRPSPPTRRTRGMIYTPQT